MLAAETVPLRLIPPVAVCGHGATVPAAAGAVRRGGLAEPDHNPAVDISLRDVNVGLRHGALQPAVGQVPLEGALVVSDLRRKRPLATVDTFERRR